jgi:hypothetical protein
MGMEIARLKKKKRKKRQVVAKAKSCVYREKHIYKDDRAKRTILVAAG